jgi:SAM-dependent methyltransferase
MSYFKYLRNNLAICVRRGQRVIDIGSGHAPFIRADVLCDRFPVETNQRPIPEIYMPVGRFVVGDIQDLPFADNAFHYAYCSAVLEHLPRPEKACAEISRIASSGLIRTPSWLWEIMGGSAAHLWLISVKENKLIFRRKTLDDIALHSLIPEKIRNSKPYEKLFDFFYDDYYVDFYWRDRINIEIIIDNTSEIYLHNSDEQVDITKEKLYRRIAGGRRLSRRLKVMIFESLRRLLGGENIDFSDIIASLRRTSIGLFVVNARLNIRLCMGFPFY